MSAAISISDASLRSAKVAAEWHEIVVPAAWAGQELHTRGELNLQRQPEAYTRKGKLALGPPDRVADIALDVHGTPERDRAASSSISRSRRGASQRAARSICKPQLAWDMTAAREDFDPGAFAAAWRGSLGFDLASQGQDAGRRVRRRPLQLTHLRGELRGRPLSGNADLTLTPPLIASGTLALNSGKSELRFRGRRGEQSRRDAVAERRIAQRLGAELRRPAAARTSSFAASGPSSRSTAMRDGSDLHAADVRVESLSAQGRRRRSAQSARARCASISPS